jgi:hypothetical protein
VVDRIFKENAAISRELLADGVIPALGQRFTAVR